MGVMMMFVFAFSQNSFAQNQASNAKGSSTQTAQCVLGTAMGAGGGAAIFSSLGPAGVAGGAFAGGVAAYAATPACTAGKNGNYTWNDLPENKGSGATIILRNKKQGE